MLQRQPLFGLLAVFFSPFLAVGQQTSTPSQTTQRDPQAIAVLTQTLSAAGGSQALAAVMDYTEAGTITYYWAGEEVQGTVTVKGRGTGQFRLDATLPDGVRSAVMDNGIGSVKEMDGTASYTPSQTAVNDGSLTFPYARLVAALKDPSTSIAYIGLVNHEGHQVHDVRTQEVYSATADPQGDQSKQTTRDCFIAPGTFQILSVLDAIYIRSSADGGIAHEVQFSNYQAVNGILVPFSITEMIFGQQTLTMQLTQITFNSNLTDSDFIP